jgi:carboxyl-terminal processing protease
MLGGLDGSGTYMTSEEVKEWNRTDDEADADPGIAVLKSFGALQVIRVVPGSPAEAAGIEVGDQVRSLAGRSLRDVSFEQALRMLRGKPGTTVVLGVLHSSEGLKREDLPVRRARRVEPAFRVDVRGETAILAVHDFGRTTSAEIVAALRDAHGKGASRLLLDLRDQVEGSPREAVPLLSALMTGDLFVRKNRSGEILERLAASGKESAWNGPVALLVNSATAGAAEGVALALQSLHQVTVYGQATFGRAAEPKLFKLSNGAGILVPASLWATTAGRTWEADGVKPDEAVLGDGKDRATASAEQLRRALDSFEKSVRAAAEAKAAA